MDNDLTVQILREIRGDKLDTKLDHHIETTAQRFDQVDAAMAGLGRRIDQTNRYMLGMEARFSTEISALRDELHEHSLRQ